MTRAGQNPLKHTAAPLPPVVSLTVVTHFTEDIYHLGRTEIVHLCLTSMLRGYTSSFPTELIIWDNGSTKQFRDMLREFDPTVLVLSENIGLGAARKRLYALARGKYLAYCDDDVFFYPGWFNKELEVLNAYPNVGCVGGSPIRQMFRANKSTLAWAEKNAAISRGHLIPERWEEDFVRSVGYSPREYHQKVDHKDDTLLEYGGVKAWAHGHHMQYLCERKAVGALYNQESILLLDAEKPTDNDIDAAGLLRLTTYDRVCRHIGNVLDDDIRETAVTLGYMS